MTLWNLVEPRGHSETVGPFGSNETLVGSHGMINPGRNLLEPWLHCDTSTEARGALESVGMLGKLTEA